MPRARQRVDSSSWSEIDLQIRIDSGTWAPANSPTEDDSQRFPSDTWPFDKLLRGKVTGIADSVKALTRVTRWMERCSVAKCCSNQEINPNLPSRLLDLGDPDGGNDPKLIVTAESGTLSAQDHRYVALSYCWGPESQTPFSTITSSSFEARKQGIPLRELPQTYQDAILLNKRLGIRYLWIDALCILQGRNSEAVEDWAKDSVAMVEVYGNAHLTIAVASASSVHEGFLERVQARSVALNLGNEEYKDKVVLYSDKIFRQAMDEPLCRRGWTLKERILSARVLIWLKDQFAWECECFTESESGVEMHSIGVMRLNDSFDDNKDDPLLVFRNTWHCIATDYSARMLTVPSDKLPTIAALAQACERVQGGIGGRYIAGMWENGLLDDLLWAHISIEQGRNTIRCRPSEYKAPSWSWVSIDGKLRWLYSGHNGNGPYYAEIRGIDIQIAQSDTNPFGCVSGGALQILRRLLRLDGLIICLQVWEGPILQFFKGVDWSHETYLDVSADQHHCELANHQKHTGSVEIWLLPVKRGAFLLLGLKNSSPGQPTRTFKRLGVVFSQPWLEGPGELEPFLEKERFNSLPEEEFYLV